MNTNTSSFKRRSLGLQPAFAWMAILGLALFTVVGVFAAGGIMRLVFPLASFAVGILLYVKYPILYIGFTWWVWFLTPLLRRLIDYRNGWDQQGIILIAPYLVTMITFATLVRYLPKSYRIGGLPFVIAFVGVSYGFLVGLIYNQPIAVFRAFLDWGTPILFGFHLFVQWREYPLYRQNLQSVFVWCLLITGIYAVIQFCIAPEWDRLWLVKSGMTSSSGQPVPFGMRVWSTMHSPAPFANVVLAGLLLLFGGQHPMGIPASVVGYLAFLLSLVRAAWGAWVVGIVTLLSSVQPKLQMRLVVTMLVMLLCVVPLTTIEPFSKVLADRFDSFANIQKDHSFRDRSETYNRNLNLAFSNIFGNGVGNTLFVNDKGKLEKIVFDSGILETFFALGWFGAIPYLGGMFLLMYKLFQGSAAAFDTFASASRSITIATFSMIVFGSSMLGLGGLAFWGFMAMGLAAQKYYQHQASSTLHNRNRQ